MKVSFYILFSFFNLSLGLSDSLKSVSDEEKIVRMIKEDQLEKKLRSSEVFKECAQIGKSSHLGLKDEIQKSAQCMERKVQSLDKGQAAKLIESLQLSRVELYGDQNQNNLAKYLSSIVQNALYGQAAHTPGTLDYLNQETFTLVYERVIGKALFFELAEFCLKKKISDPNKLNLTGVADIFKDPVKTQNEISTCISSIKNSCNKNSTTYDAAGCLFHRRMIEFKTVLTQLKQDKEFWLDVKKQSTAAFKLTYLDKKPRPQKDSNKIASELTNISSTKLVDEGYGESNGELSNQAKEMEKECLNQPTDENCKKYFNRGIGQSLGQYRLQKELEIDLKIKALEDLDENNLHNLAEKSNHFSQKELQQLKNESKEEIKKRLKEKYDGEKQAIIENINERLDVAKWGISRDEDLKNATKQLKYIHEHLKNKPDELRAVNFFSNAIVAFFHFKNDPEKKRRVFSGIDTELEDLKLKVSDSETKKAIKYLEGIKKVPGRSAASDQENYFLDPEDLDHILFP